MFKKIINKYKQIMEQAGIESQLEKEILKKEKAKRTEKWSQDKAAFQNSISIQTLKQEFDAAKQEFINDPDMQPLHDSINEAKQDMHDSINEAKQDMHDFINEAKQDMISNLSDIKESADVFKEFTKLNKTKLSPADYGPEYLELWKREQALINRQNYTDEDNVELKLIVKRQMEIYKQHLKNNQKIAEERAKQKRINRENEK